MLDIDSSMIGASKKRKDNDGRVNVPNVSNNINRSASGVDEHVSYFNKSSCNNGTSSSQLDRMETIIMRMEQKLASMSSLESRFAELEAKCSSLESMLQASTILMTEKFDSLNINLDKKCRCLEDKMEKLHKYNDMLVRNQSWEYSAEKKSEDEWLEDGYEYNAAEYVAGASEELEDVTTKMRQGEFIDEKMHKIGLKCSPFHDECDYSGELLPAWKEFAAALKQFTPAIDLVPEACESCFELNSVQLHGVASALVKEALLGKPFKKLDFIHCTTDGREYNDMGGLSMDAIMDVAESNKHLRTLQIYYNCMNRDHIERFCYIVHNHTSLADLTVYCCFHPDFGNADLGDSMLTSLLTTGELKLKKLNLSFNNFTPAVETTLADFLAANPPLETLNLELNGMNDNIVSSITNALRSNATLREIRLGTRYDRNGNDITHLMQAALKSILFDESSLNAVADLNHTLESFDRYDIAMYNSMVDNRMDSTRKPVDVKMNRGAKIYALLSKRNSTLSNVEHFSDIDVKILPDLLESVQRYAQSARLRKKYAPPIYDTVESLSIVYEVMRKWDKVFNLYESRVSKS